MKNIEDYGFERSDLVVAGAVNAYLNDLPTEERKGTLERIVWRDDRRLAINTLALTQLIESAKANAMASAQAWKDGGDPLVKKSITFIREQLLTVNGKEYAKNPPRGFLRFLVDRACQFA